jgi:hypothetical protein
MQPIAVASLVAVAACAGTAAPPATPATRAAAPPALKAPLDSLAFYVGSWQCKGTSFATADTPEKHWDARVDVTPELDGRWLSVVMTGPDANHTAEHKGYDPVDKRWHHLGVGNDGTWVVMSSPGWDGARMVFSPDAKTETESWIATFTKRGEREYSHAVSLITDAGEERVWEKVCTRS